MHFKVQYSHNWNGNPSLMMLLWTQKCLSLVAAGDLLATFLDSQSQCTATVTGSMF